MSAVRERDVRLIGLFSFFFAELSDCFIAVKLLADLFIYFMSWLNRPFNYGKFTPG